MSFIFSLFLYLSSLLLSIKDKEERKERTLRVPKKRKQTTVLLRSSGLSRQRQGCLNRFKGAYKATTQATGYPCSHNTV
jgi:hypothetical protein